MRTIASRLAVLLSALLLLAACGGGSEETRPAPDAGTDSAGTGASDGGGPSDSGGTSDGGGMAGTSDGGSAGSTTSDEEPAEPSTDAASAATEIEHLWVDGSWTIEDQQDDLCAMGGPSVAQYSDQDDLFICGPNASGALSCAVEQGEEVVCITDALEQKAIRFDSPTAVDPSTEWYERGMEPMPLTVTLEDGVVCDTISHDHDQHWNQMFSWYRCDDGSELLTDQDIANTFARGETWTAQRSVDAQEPEETAVAVVTYAGR